MEVSASAHSTWFSNLADHFASSLHDVLCGETMFMLNKQTWGKVAVIAAYFERLSQI